MKKTHAWYFPDCSLTLQHCHQFANKKHVVLFEDCVAYHWRALPVWPGPSALAVWQEAGFLEGWQKRWHELLLHYYQTNHPITLKAKDLTWLSLSESINYLSTLFSLCRWH